MSKSNLKLTGLLLLFLLIGIVFAFFPIYSSVHLYGAIGIGADKIAFDKGAYYLFGGALLFIVGPVWSLYILAFSKRQTESTKQMSIAQQRGVQRVVYTFFGVCVVSTFILPQVMSIVVGNYLENRGYAYCDKLSHQWMFVRTMVYTKDKCEDEDSANR